MNIAKIQDLKSAILDIQESILIKKQDLSSLELERDTFDNSSYVNESDFIEEFEEALDEAYSEVYAVSGFYYSTILKNCDPISYDISLTEYVDAFDSESIPEFNNILEGIEEAEEELFDLENEIGDIESEIEYLESETLNSIIGLANILN